MVPTLQCKGGSSKIVQFHPTRTLRKFLISKPKSYYFFDQSKKTQKLIRYQPSQFSNECIKIKIRSINLQTQSTIEARGRACVHPLRSARCAHASRLPGDHKPSRVRHIPHAHTGASSSAGLRWRMRTTSGRVRSWYGRCEAAARASARTWSRELPRARAKPDRV